MKNCAIRAAWPTTIVIIQWVLAAAAGAQVGPIVQLPPTTPGCEGISYEGFFEYSAEGRAFTAFLGIRYAQAPVGDLRFMPPLELPNNNCTTNETIPAVKEGNCCVQYDVLFGSGLVLGDEDCLFLNVYTPAHLLPENGDEDLESEDLPPDPIRTAENGTETTSRDKRNSTSSQELLPVMVWIHGGGFLHGCGTPNLFGPCYFMDRDVVLVTINYRLNIFGFLSTEDAEYPGNMGLFDQTMALKWVKNNIRSFGGNPDLVTVFGESAGAASASFHMISPQSTGLFHRVITQSGTANAQWALQPNASAYAGSLAAEFNCSTPENNNKSAMVQCLKKIPAKLLLKSFAPWQNGGKPSSSLVWVPRIDAEAKSPFLPAAPLKLMKEGNFTRVPYLNGIMKDEGLSLTYASFMNAEWREAAMSNWKAFAPVAFSVLRENLRIGDKDLREIRNAYFAKNATSTQNLYDLRRSAGDLWFAYPAYEASEIISQFVPTYSSVMDYASQRSHQKSIMIRTTLPCTDERRYTKIWGTCHSDVLPFLFDSYSSDLITSENDREDFEMKELLLDTFTNFAKHGNPNGDTTYHQEAMLVPWPKYVNGSSGSKIYVYNPTPSLVSDFLPKDKVDFWRSFFQRYGPS